MKKHIKNFIKHYGLAEGEFMACQYCCLLPVNDIHHVIYRSAGGSDEVSNLVGLCRPCHQKAHNKTIKAEELLEIAEANL